jgi:DNA polymerase III subunit beta
MKLEIQKEYLLYAVNAVERAVSTKNTLPVLGGIMIVAKDNKVCFKATDLEMAVECVVNANIEEEGEIVAPGRKLAQLAKGLTSQTISIESVGQEQLIIKYERGQISMPCFSPEDFPLLPSQEGNINGSIPVRTFRRLVKQTGIASSTDELRPIFTGILFDIDENNITMIATDTHRLAVSKDTWMGQGKTSVIVPNKVMQEISRLAVSEEDNIIITISQSQIFFSFANLIVTSRLIVGSFPDYHQVLPAKDQYISNFSVSRQSLIESLELASVISREISRGKGNIIRLRLDKDSINIYAYAQDEGTFDENQLARINGEKLTLNYNARYLLDVLKVMDEENIIFNLTGATTPGVIVADNEDNDKYLYLILPVRVSK